MNCSVGELTASMAKLFENTYKMWMFSKMAGEFVSFLHLLLLLEEKTEENHVQTPCLRFCSCHWRIDRGRTSWSAKEKNKLLLLLSLSWFFPWFFYPLFWWRRSKSTHSPITGVKTLLLNTFLQGVALTGFQFDWISVFLSLLSGGCATFSIFGESESTFLTFFDF